MKLNPMYVNDLVDKVAKAIDQQEATHAALALVTCAFSCIKEAGNSNVKSRKILREMLDYAIENAVDAEKLKKELNNAN